MTTPELRSWLRRAAWALLWLLVLSLPIEKSLVFAEVGSVSRMLGVAAFTSAVAAAVLARGARIPNAALCAAAAYVAWCCLTPLWSVARSVSWVHAATLAQLLGMLWLVWECCRTRRQHTWLLRAYAAGAAVASVVAMARYGLGEQTYYLRYAAPGFDPNDFGITLALALPFGLHLSASSRGWAAWLVRGAAALILAALLLTGSRTALVGACLAFAYPALTWRAATPVQRIASAALLLLLILGALWLAPRPSRQRLATLPREMASGTLHGRTRIWKAGLRVLKHHWMRGIGVGAYPEAVKPWLGTPGVPGMQYTAHNTFLSILVEAGVPGLLLFLLLLATLGLFAWMLAPAGRALWLTTLAVWIAGTFTLSWEQRKPTWLIFGLIMTAWAMCFAPGEKAG